MYWYQLLGGGIGMKEVCLAAIFVLGLDSIAYSQVKQHYVCVGEFKEKCREYFASRHKSPGLPDVLEFYGCGPTSTKDSNICYRYCGKPQTRSTCSVSNIRNYTGDRCGYHYLGV